MTPSASRVATRAAPVAQRSGEPPPRGHPRVDDPGVGGHPPHFELPLAVAAVILGTTTPEAAGLLAIITENEGASLPTFFLFAIGFVILTLPLGIYFTRLSRRLAVKR